MSFLSDNQKERFTFVKKWAEYVRTHSDKVWSKQQNVVINAGLRTSKITISKNEK